MVGGLLSGKETMAVEVKKSIARGSIQLLLSRLILASGISMVVIIVGSGYGIYRIYSNHIIHAAEDNAVQLGQALVLEQRDLLFSRDPAGRPRLFVDPRNLETLDRRLRPFLHSFQIVKIKIYNAGRKIIFSTEPALIGQVDGANRRLLHALQGDADSHLENKGSLRDLANEEQLNVDVVESYVPIRVGPVVVGAFEVYVDVTRYRHQIVTTVANSVLILGGILLAVFGVSFFFVKSAARHVKEVQQKLHIMATTDALTGTLNRGTILAHAREEISLRERRRQQKTGYSLSFILLDIDNFKQINDTYGHLVGDKVLEEVVQRVREAARDYDLLGRFGGEEFLLVLPDASFAGAVAAAERVRQAVDARPFASGAPEIRMTVSLGVATSRPGEENLDEVLHRADAGLYKAKAAGRNRVAWIEPPATS